MGRVDYPLSPGYDQFYSVSLDLKRGKLTEGQSPRKRIILKLIPYSTVKKNKGKRTNTEILFH